MLAMTTGLCRCLLAPWLIDAALFLTRVEVLQESGLEWDLQPGEGGCERTEGGAEPQMHFLSKREAAH